MKNDSDLLRQLHKVQISIPDKHFFENLQAEIKSDAKKRRKSKSGFLSNAPFMGGKKYSKVDIEIAREKIKSFNSSFKTRRHRQDPDEPAEPGKMGIQEMNDFRNSIKEASEAEDEGYSYRALDGIVKFVDLKNSGVSGDKQEILFDCLKRLSLVLMEDGGLSMFHATWFYTIYKDYMGHYRMFRKGEFEKVTGVSSKEVKDITGKLHQKQYELPLYLQLIDENKRDIKQLLRYSKDLYVKRSIHGQKGCKIAHIKKVFHDKINASASKTSEQNSLNEVNIIIAYALFFTRFPMMHPLVENLARSIPNLGTETTIYKEKIMISLNLVQLDLMRGVARNDGTDQYGNHLLNTAYSVFKRCTNLISDNRLTASSLISDIYAFPYLKQAVILIAYKQIFKRNRGVFLKMIENSQQLLKTLNDAAKGPQRHLMKTREFVDVYKRNLDAIIEQIKMEPSPENQPASKTKK